MSISYLNRLGAIDFSRTIERLAEGFTGREWLFDKLDDWLQQEDGEKFYLLTGEPGVGKSAIAARLTQRWADANPEKAKLAAYHFCRAGDVETVRPGRVLRSLATQLGKTLPHYGEALKEVLDQVHVRIDVNINIDRLSNSQVTGIYVENLKDLDPREEFRLLIQAPLTALSNIYTSLGETPPALKVFLIDSLDEAATTTGQENMVTLLASLYQARETLPHWLRFLLTARPDRSVLNQFLPLQSQKIEELEAKNLSDIQRYVQGRVNEQLREEPSTPESQTSNAIVTNSKSLKKRLVEANLTAEKLVGEVKELSHGNFLYTKLLLNSIASGEQSIKNLSALPKNLNDIYHRILRYRCSFRGWLKRYQPILGTLSVTQEPISQAQLSKFIRIGTKELDDNLSVFRQFLDESKDEQGQPLYAIFHRSLREYLLDRKHNHDFWCDAKEQHDNIIEYCERESQNWQDLSAIDLYELRHLAQHLVRANQVDELHRLLSREKSGRNAWFDAKDHVAETAGFLSDITLAWNQVDKTCNDRPEEIIGLQCRYALTMNSVNSFANNIPEEILLALIEHSINNVGGSLWTPIQSLTYAHQMQNFVGKAKLLSKIAFHLSNPLKEKVLEEVLGIVQIISDSGALIELALCVPETIRNKILQAALLAAREKKPDKDRVGELIALAPFLPELQRYETFQEAVRSITKIEIAYERIEGVDNILPFVPDSLLEDLIEAIQGVIKITPQNQFYSSSYGGETQYELTLSVVFRKIAQRLYEPRKSEILQEALKLARKVSQRSDRTQLLIQIIPDLQEPLRNQMLNEALMSAQSVDLGWSRAQLLNQLIPNLPEPLKCKVLDEAVAAILTTLPHPLRSYQAVVTVLEKAVSDLQEIEISESSKSEIVQKIVTIILGLEDERVSTLAVVGLAVWSDLGLNDFMQVKTMAAIIPFLPEAQRKDTLTKALDLARGIKVNPILFEKSNKRAIDFVSDSATYQVRALTSLAPFFQEPEQQLLIFEEALNKVKSIKYTNHLRKAITILAKSLPDSLKFNLLDEVKNFNVTPFNKVSILKSVLPYLPEPLKITASREALLAAQAIKDPRLQVRELHTLVTLIANSLEVEAIKATLIAAREEINDKIFQAPFIIELAKIYPTETLLRQTLEVIEDVDINQKGLGFSPLEKQIGMLIDVVPYLSEPLLQRGLALVRSTKKAVGSTNPFFNEAWALGEIALQLPAPLKVSLQQEAVTISKAINYPINRLYTFAKLLPGLADENVPYKSSFLSKLLQKAPTSLKEQVVQDSLTAIKERNYDIDASILCEILPYLTESCRAEILKKSIEMIWKKSNSTSGWKLQELIRFMPYLPNSILKNTLTKIRGIEDPEVRVEGLAAILQFLTERLRIQVLNEALATAKTLEDDRFQNHYRAECIIYVIPYLSGSLKEETGKEALNYIRMIPEKRRRLLLAKLALHLQEPLKSEVIEESLNIDDEYSSDTHEVIFILAQCFPEHLIPEALKVLTQSMVGSSDRSYVKAFKALVGRLIQLPSTSLYPLWCETLHDLTHRDRRTLLLSLQSLIPVIITLSNPEVAEQIFKVLQDTSSQWGRNN